MPVRDLGEAHTSIYPPSEELNVALAAGRIMKRAVSSCRQAVHRAPKRAPPKIENPVTQRSI